MQDLKPTADFGCFQLVAAQAQLGNPAGVQNPGVGSAPMAGTVQELKGRRWVVLTGLVPIEKQMQAYLDAFRHTAGYETQPRPARLFQLSCRTGGGSRSRRGIDDRLDEGPKLELL